MSDYLDSILNFLSPEAGQARRRKLDLALMELIPPEMRPQLGLVTEMNPVVSMERAGTAAGRVANPSLSGWERMAAAGDTLSNMAGVVGPAAAARRVGMPVANAVQETLLGMAMSPEAVAAKNVGNAVVERLNQPGPMPTTYSNPIFGRMTLWHGTDSDPFTVFDPSRARTARHIYTSPVKEDAAAYGKNLLEFETDARIADFRPGFRGRNEMRVLREAYEGGLADYFDTFDDFVEAFDAGDMYQRFASQAAQNDVISNLLYDAEGVRRFDGVRIPDAGFGGRMSESVVFDDPSMLHPPGILSAPTDTAMEWFWDANKKAYVLRPINE